MMPNSQAASTWLTLRVQSSFITPSSALSKLLDLSGPQFFHLKNGGDRYDFTLRCFSCVQLFVTLWTIACKGPLFMGFSRQEYWSGLPCPSPGDLPSPGIKPMSPASPALQVDSSPTEPHGKPECDSPGL